MIEEIYNPEKDTEVSLFTSDIHLENNSDLNKTRIEFSMPLEKEESKINFDSDGDLVTNRHEKKYVIFIEHETKTKLEDVGFQLWRSSLYLSDFILNNSDFFKNKIVVDLGSGLGITSFISSFFSNMVYCTDLEKVVKKAEQNWLQNKENLQDILLNKNINIKFKALNWFDHETILNRETLNDNKYYLKKNDHENLKQASIFLASDIIYDTDLTVQFFNLIYKLLTFGSKQRKDCFIANEKRINFSLDTLSITDVSYDLYMSFLNDLNDYQDLEKGFKFKIEKVETKVLKQFIHSYKRNDYLDIWKIICQPI